MNPPEEVFLYMHANKRWYMSKPEHVEYRVRKDAKNTHVPYSQRFGKLWVLEPGHDWVELDPKAYLT